jgi:hypothetical protein
LGVVGEQAKSARHRPSDSRTEVQVRPHASDATER